MQPTVPSVAPSSPVKAKPFGCASRSLDSLRFGQETPISAHYKPGRGIFEVSIVPALMSTAQWISMKNRVFWIVIGVLFLAAALGVWVTLQTGTPAYAAAIATFTAAIAALFKEDIVHAWRKPRLSIRMLLKAPDCMLVPVVVTFKDNGGEQRWTGDCYFLRLWIENDGSHVAERVQVYVKSVKHLMGDGRHDEVPEFTPMNLRWPHSPDPAKPILFETLNPHMGKHCDFASVSPPTNPTETLRGGMKEGESTFNLQTEVFSNNEGHRLRPGRYMIDLLVAASNAKPKQFTVQLDWNGQCESSPSRMFVDSVKIKMSES